MSTNSRRKFIGTLGAGIAGTATLAGGQALYAQAPDVQFDIVPGGDDTGIEKAVSGALGEFFKAEHFTKIFVDILKHVVDELSKLVSPFGSIADQLPLDIFHALSNLGELLAVTGAKDAIVRRAHAVNNSAQQLVKDVLRDDRSGLSHVLANSVKQQILQLIKLFDTPGGAFDVSQFSSITDLISQVFSSAANTEFLTLLPRFPSPPIGQIQAWLNDHGKYFKDYDVEKPSGINSWDELIPIARQYRARLIAEYDAYFRRKVASEYVSQEGDKATTNTFRHSDERTGYELIADVVSIFLVTTTTFIFEPECFPGIQSEIEHFEDVGVEVATALSRSMRAGIRGAMSGVFRGAWVWSVMNDALIEMIATAVGTALSATVEAVLRNVSWTFRIATAYEELIPRTITPLHTWPSLETVSISNESPERKVSLVYVAIVRQAGLSAESLARLRRIIEERSEIRGFIEDMGAYLDVCYQSFRTDSRFPEIARRGSETGIVGDEVQASTYTVDDMLIIDASSSDEGQPLRPVMRVYYPCGSIVMAPNLNRPGYSAIIRMPRRAQPFDVLVLSNRGGRTRVRVSPGNEQRPAPVQPNRVVFQSRWVSIFVIGTRGLVHCTFNVNGRTINHLAELLLISIEGGYLRFADRGNHPWVKEWRVAEAPDINGESAIDYIADDGNWHRFGVATRCCAA